MSRLVLTRISVVRKYFKYWIFDTIKLSCFVLSLSITFYLFIYSAHASVQNGHKITTFDGFDYDLPLDCTFVLTKDFMDGNFSLILSNDGETSLTVLSKGKQISLKLSGEVRGWNFRFLWSFFSLLYNTFTQHLILHLIFPVKLLTHAS